MAQSKCDLAIHELASTIGRARVYLDNEQSALAKREVNAAAEALGWLRRALTAEADAAENEARIRERVEGAPQRGCPHCGDPHAAINADGKCDLCEGDVWMDAAREKLSPEELHPESTNEPKEVK